LPAPKNTRLPTVNPLSALTEDLLF